MLEHIAIPLVTALSVLSLRFGLFFWRTRHNVCHTKTGVAVKGGRWVTIKTLVPDMIDPADCINGG